MTSSAARGERVAVRRTGIHSDGIAPVGTGAAQARSPTREVSSWRRVVVAAALVLFGTLVYDQGWLWRIDNVTYDASLRLWQTPPPEEVVIVAVDDASLAAIGRWPWRRSVHARLVDELARAEAAAIGLDILFVEPDFAHPGDDTAFAEALRKAGNAVLAVNSEQLRGGGQLVEQLPIPPLTETARGLGHIHVELDDDGVARAVYLRAGLGFPRWQAFAMMLEEVASGVPRKRVPGLTSGGGHAGPNVWVRNHGVLVPFAGPPGHIQQVSYINVLSGDYAPGLFAGKVVLVGATAAGIGDTLPTPVSGKSRPMSGVEYHANVLHALREGRLIEPLAPLVGTLLTGLFALLPVLVYPRTGPRGSLPAAVAMLLAPALLAYLLLRFGHMWFPPAAAMSVALVSYPLWSWARLNAAVRFLSGELGRLGDEQDQLPVVRRPAFPEATRFLGWLLPIDGFALVDERGRVFEQSGQAPQWRARELEPGEVTRDGAEVWGALEQGGRQWRLGNHWANGEPEERHLELLRSIVRLQGDGAVGTRRPRGTVEVLERQIDALGAANDRIGAVRRILDASLDQMADGLLIVTSLGTVMLANERAGRLLRDEPGQLLEEQTIVTVLEGVSADAHRRWPDVVAEVLVDRRSVQVSAIGPEDRSLLLHFAPLGDRAVGLLGFTVSVTDLTQLRDSERKREELLEFLSHDLRSPLVSLLAVVELARDREANAGELRDALQRCGQHAGRALRLADGFSDVVHAESAPLPDQPVADACAAARAAVDSVRPQSERRSMEIAVSVPPAPVYVQAEASLLERVLQNLLGNAIKYGADRSRVRLAVNAGESEVTLSVADEGRGIARQDLARIFDRFERLEDSRATTGVGLGLAFVKAAVERAGGKVVVDSQVGGGSTFVVTLRRSPAPQQLREAAEE